MAHSLLKNDWTVAKIEEVLARHPRKPLLPVLGSEAWLKAGVNPLVRQYIKPLRARAEKECAEPLPELTDELYSGFHRTGSRLAFESVYFERRRRLARAVISLLLCDEDDPLRKGLADSAVSKITSVFEEVSWALPAHVNSHASDVTSGKDPLEIDLFCTETANVMAELIDLLGGVMPASLRERIRGRLLHQVFATYLDESLTPRFEWKHCTNNWNAVCHQGIVGAALSQLDDPRLLAEILASAAKCLPFFLSGFGDDGGCSEGPGYWNYGFGWFAELNRQLESRTDGELSLFEGDQHIHAIARYGPRVSLSGGNLVNFSDTGASGGLSPSLLAYLGDRLGDQELHHLALENYQMILEKGIDLEAERCDLFHLTRLILRCPGDLSAPAVFTRRDCYMPDLAVLVSHGTDSRGHLWEFAAKAGHNDEHHNHNDCGNYILNIDGVRLVTEIGAPDYVKDFFGPKRYEFLAARSLGHSLPVINGREQEAGRIHASKILSHSLTADDSDFLIDATACYPAEAGCRKFVRAFHLDKTAGTMTVEDEFELDRAESLEDAVVTIHPASISGDHAVIKAEKLELLLQAAPGTRFVRIESHPYRNRAGHEASINRLVFTTEDLAPQARMGFTIRLR